MLHLITCHGRIMPHLAELLFNECLENFVRMFVWAVSRPKSNMGHVGSKTRSVGQILGKPCVPNRGSLNLHETVSEYCLNNI